MAGKAAERSRLPRPFCYFLGNAKKVKRRKATQKKNLNFLRASIPKTLSFMNE
jgi:hypothetical protein